ncbi:Vasohibin [Novymonas esmeraldas]|uniref:Vasohibin n=1 Tax=Novymonas esmeraldas TaxID=1808958 RepID=A0AAW0F9Q0_9TRYP
MADKVQGIVEQLSQQNPFNGCADLPDPPRPSEAAIPRDRPSVEQIPHIQTQINILTYNHLPRTFFSLEKHRSLQSVLFTAKEALAEALPIRCLEATFVALHFTQTLRDIDRIPLSFKSEANGNFYRHIVLVLRTRSTPTRYGALGLSRKPTLMYKPLTYTTLFDLVMDYRREYEVLGHELLDIKLGIAITHDERSRWNPCWRFIALKLDHYRDDDAVGASPTQLPGDPHKPTSPCTPQTQVRRRTARAANGSFASSSNGVLPPLSLGASGAASSPRSLHSDAPPDRLARVPSDSHREAGGAVSAPFSPLSNSAALMSPTVAPHPSVALTPPRPSCTPTERATAAYAPLAQLLSNYMRLLPTICEQFYRGIAAVDNNNRALKLCFMDLDCAERDSGAENQRRLQHIAEMQSPLSAEAKRVAASRQLKPPKKERNTAKAAASTATTTVAPATTNSASTGSGAGGGGGGGSAKGRQPSCSGGVGSSRAPRRASPAPPPSVGIVDARKGAAAAAARHGSGTRQAEVSAAPDAALPTATSLDAPPTAVPSERAASLSAALASIHHIARSFLPLHTTVVDAQERQQQHTGGSASPVRGGDSETDGFRSPCEPGASPGTRSVDALAAPPRTPRNYNAHRQLSLYAASPRSASSASDLYSAHSSLEASMAHTKHNSP